MFFNIDLIFLPKMHENYYENDNIIFRLIYTKQITTFTIINSQKLSSTRPNHLQLQFVKNTISKLLLKPVIILLICLKQVLKLWSPNMPTHPRYNTQSLYIIFFYVLSYIDKGTNLLIQKGLLCYPLKYVHSPLYLPSLFLSRCPILSNCVISKRFITGAFCLPKIHLGKYMQMLQNIDLYQNFKFLYL